MWVFGGCYALGAVLTVFLNPRGDANACAPATTTA